MQIYTLACKFGFRYKCTWNIYRRFVLECYAKKKTNGRPFHLLKWAVLLILITDNTGYNSTGHNYNVCKLRLWCRTARPSVNSISNSPHAGTITPNIESQVKHSFSYESYPGGFLGHSVLYVVNWADHFELIWQHLYLSLLYFLFYIFYLALIWTN